MPNKLFVVAVSQPSNSRIVPSRSTDVVLEPKVIVICSFKETFDELQTSVVLSKLYTPTQSDGVHSSSELHPIVTKHKTKRNKLNLTLKLYTMI